MGLGKRAFDDAVQYFQMRPGGDFRHHPAIRRMRLGLAEHDIGQDLSRPRRGAAHHRSGGFIAAGLNAENGESLQSLALSLRGCSSKPVLQACKAMRILVTRPLEDAQGTAQILAARGHRPLIAPLLQTIFLDGPLLVLDGVQALLATSANGVRALARRTPRRDLPVFAVGPQTAAAAAAAGFVTVRNADGDARALARAAGEWARPDAGALLHVSGEDSSGALAENLRGRGFTVAREILYAVTVLPLPPEAAEALKRGALDAALFFSPRNAQVFRDCVLQETLPTASLTAICISAATQAALAPLPFAAIRVAKTPNQEALMACLD
jgi:uroporphyrinogen-III synthase